MQKHLNGHWIRVGAMPLSRCFREHYSPSCPGNARFFKTAEQDGALLRL